MNDVVQINPKTLARIMTELGDTGFTEWVDKMGIPGLRIISNPEIAEDMMIVPPNWLDNDTDTSN